MSFKTFLIRGLLGSAGLRICFALLTFALSVALARLLLPEGYGIYSFAYAVASLLAIPSQAGMPQLIVRQVALYISTQEWGLLRGILNRSSQWICTLSVLLSLALLTAGWFLYANNNSEKFWSFIGASLLIPLMALNAVRSAALRGLGKVVLGQVSEMLLAPGLFLLMVCILAYFMDLDAPLALAANSFSVFCAFLFGSMALKRSLPGKIHKVKPAYDTERWLKSVLPFALIAGMQVINLQIGVLALGVFCGDEETGLYRVAVQSANIVSLILIATNMVIAPKAAQLFHTGNLKKLQQIVVWSARVGFMFAAPLTFVFVFFGGPFLSFVFGDRYRDAAVALMILSGGQLFSVFIGPVATILNMAGFEKVTLKGVFSAASCNIIMNLSLTPIYGLTGTAIAAVTSLILWNIYLSWQTKRLMGIKSSALYL